MRLLRTLPLAVAVLAAAPAVLAQPAAAKPLKGTFNISLYGVQRYESTFSRTQMPEYNSFDQRGTIAEHGVVRFHTAKPRRAVLVGDGSYVNIRWLGESDGPDLSVLADFSNSGETKMENATGIVAGGAQWAAAPSPDASSCTAHTDHQGFNLSLSTGRAEVVNTSSVLVPVVNPLEKCPYADRSLGLYPAKARVPIRGILTDDKTEIVLRYKDRSDSETPTQTFHMRKKTTVYVVFKRVGSRR
jgi:hypothetical protein